MIESFGNNSVGGVNIPGLLAYVYNVNINTHPPKETPDVAPHRSHNLRGTRI